jgi:hypothetical protein
VSSRVTKAEDARLFEEVNTELAYNLELHERVVEPMVQHFTTVIPSRCEEAVSRWSTFVTHPDVPDLIVSLRDDRISNEERTSLHEELIVAAEEAFGERVH